jgi:hypothetical protein
MSTVKPKMITFINTGIAWLPAVQIKVSFYILANARFGKFNTTPSTVMAAVAEHGLK